MVNKYIHILILLLLTIVWGCKPKEEISTVQKIKERTLQEVNKDMVTKKIVMIIANKNFRDEEYFEPKKVLSSAGIKIVTASSSLNESIGMLGGKAKPDILLSDIKVDDYDAIIFVGGIGSSEYWDNKIAHNIIIEALNKNKIVAAICIAPVTLANAGILKNKKATVFSSEKDKIIKSGAKYLGDGVVQDGLIITASGPNYASEFGEKIKQALSSK